jgi:hypothetical protein
MIAMLNEQFGALGYLIVGIFIASWLVSLAIYRIKGYDRPGPVESLLKFQNSDLGRMSHR